ncbi:MAG: ZIP family metal transporter [Oligoflexia bacterium]|nr:ZIP family metal transporter [Oligoflexia bacterium]
MQSGLGLILAASLLASIATVLGASALLVLPRLQHALKGSLLSYAVGTLLGATFLGLLPEAAAHLPFRTVLQLTLLGFLAFFILEKVLRVPHRHAHAHEHEHGHRHEYADRARLHPAVPLILFGDTIHNLVDGLLITAAFTTSTALGTVTALAVLLHEIPQELSDFVILLEAGVPPRRAFAFNLLSALATPAGALLGYHFAPDLAWLIPHILVLAAAGFLYVATVDLAPVLHHESSARSGALQTLWLTLGTGTTYFLEKLTH